MTTHTIQLELAFCDAVLSGEKSFEIRLNDRGYQKGDRIKFMSIENSLRCYHEIDKREYEITYVLNGWGLSDGYVVFGIKDVTGHPPVESGWEVTDRDATSGHKCYHCPECGNDEWRYEATKFCPHCGTRMN